MGSSMTGNKPATNNKAGSQEALAPLNGQWFNHDRQ
jgi:hypothetical protein